MGIQERRDVRLREYDPAEGAGGVRVDLDASEVAWERAHGRPDLDSDGWDEQHRNHERRRHGDSVRFQEVGDLGHAILVQTFRPGISPGNTMLVQMLRPGIHRRLLPGDIWNSGFGPCEATARKSASDTSRKKK